MDAENNTSFERKERIGIVIYDTDDHAHTKPRRSVLAPAYYMGRPAEMWIPALSRRGHGNAHTDIVRSTRTAA